MDDEARKGLVSFQGWIDSIGIGDIGQRVVKRELWDNPGIDRSIQVDALETSDGPGAPVGFAVEWKLAGRL
ncbi:MAG: hypothetical protein FHP94_02630 [Denitromonas halophila]|nr:MAG: hypothetical protein FHP94_02630 [Denitromonas halophila]TVT71364.1 MAG: hypothetical protein FHP93_11025 [Denitromonas halophila]